MIFVPALHALQSAIGVYGMYVSYVSITNLLQYEEKTKQAAKYSNTAAHQLHKTRTTQASGALSILASLIASLVLATSSSHVDSGYLPMVRLLTSPAMLLITFAARTHVFNFWHASAKVPFMDGYNDAVSNTKNMLQVLQLLGLSWAGTALAAFVVGY